MFLKGTWTFPNEKDLRQKMDKAMEFLSVGVEKSYFRKRAHERVQFFDAFFKVLDLKDFNWDHFIEKHRTIGCRVGRHMLAGGYYDQFLTFHGKGLDKRLEKTMKTLE